MYITSCQLFCDAFLVLFLLTVMELLIPYAFSPDQRVSSSILCSASLVALNSLRMLLSCKFFLFPSVMTGRLFLLQKSWLASVVVQYEQNVISSPPGSESLH